LIFGGGGGAGALGPDISKFISNNMDKIGNYHYKLNAYINVFFSTQDVLKKLLFKHFYFIQFVCFLLGICCERREQLWYTTFFEGWVGGWME